MAFDGKAVRLFQWVAAAALIAAAPARAGNATGDAGDPRLDGVAMLINERHDGKTGWGAAIPLDDEGLALTNLHVVADSKRLLALLHDERQPSYTAADGGLARTLFERTDDLMCVELVRGDPRASTGRSTTTRPGSSRLGATATRATTALRRSGLREGRARHGCGASASLEQPTTSASRGCGLMLHGRSRARVGSSRRGWNGCVGLRPRWPRAGPRGSG